jgi:tRNA(Ile)-lysidine synthase
MLQGAGVAGCVGMKPHRKQGELNIWRPFLNVSRASIEAYLQERKETWFEDPSNADCTLWRNKIRQQIFPAMQAKGMSPRDLFLRWQKQAKRVQQRIESLAQAIVIQKLSYDNTAYCQMNWQVWQSMQRPVRAHVLQKMIGILFADGKVFGRRHIQAIEQWKEHGGHGWLNLSGCCLYRQGEYLQLCQGNKSLRDESKARLEVKA